MKTTLDDDSIEEKEPSQLLSVEGVIMLSIAGMLDLLGYISIALILLFGVGVIMGRIVSICGFIIIGGWQFTRSGKIPKRKTSPTGGLVEKVGKKFFKKHWKKLAAEALPVIGDIWPTFILFVYEELR